MSSNEVALARANTSDGFDTVPDTAHSGVIRGTIIKFDNSGDWVTKDGGAPPAEMVAVDVAIADQRWEAGYPVEIITYEDGKPLANLDEMNAAIPEDRWDIGPYGSKPPWTRQYVIYLLDHTTGAVFTSINGTVGQARAFETLKSRVSVTRRIRGQHCCPVVRLSSAPMKTKYGIKDRPEFEIVGWQGAAAPEMPRIESPATAELIDDGLPF